MNFLNSSQLTANRQSPLYKNISIVANHIVSRQTQEDVSIAIALVEKEMFSQNVPFEELKRLNLFLCEGGEFSMSLSDIGNHISFAVINCDLLEGLGNQFARVAVIVEEMVHFYWDISNELKIKYIVHHIVSLLWFNIEIGDIFALDTIPSDKQKELLTLSKDAFDNKIDYL